MYVLVYVFVGGFFRTINNVMSLDGCIFVDIGLYFVELKCFFGEI